MDAPLTTYKPRRKNFWTDARMMFGAYLVAIVAGALALGLPGSQCEGVTLNFLDRIFTSTSAVCVTGLVVVDTATTFTRQGQWILLILIELGGIGILTFTTWLLMLAGRQLGSLQRTSAGSAYGRVRGVRWSSILLSVFLFTSIIEAVGTLWLASCWRGHFSGSELWFQSFFHAVSAFCNAGFSTHPEGLTIYMDALGTNAALGTLVILGGLGFIVLHELTAALLGRRGWRTLSLHTRLVLVMTGILLLAGAIFIFVFEHNFSLDQAGLKGRALASLFQSMTTRTAGFNTLPLAQLAPATLFVMMILMVVGASPGSTGGGIKTTSFTILFAMIRSYVLGRDEVEVMERRLPRADVARALAAITLYCLTTLIAATLILLSQGAQVRAGEHQELFLPVLFETISALSTVGLSLDYTPQLTGFSRVVVIVLMLAGRLGPISIMLSFVGRVRGGRYQYPEESVLTG